MPRAQVVNLSWQACAITIASLLLASSCTRQSSPSSQVRQPPTDTTPTDVFEKYLESDVVPADGFDFPFGDGDGGGTYQDIATGQTHSGWYTATRFGETYELGIHTGEDWNGAGGGNTDLGQDVFAVANGRVVFAGDCGRLWGNVIVIEHVFYENHERKTIRSLYAHLQTMKVRANDPVRRRQGIATIGQDPDKLFSAHLHLELRWDETLSPTYWPSSDNKDLQWIQQHYTDPSSFINSHRKTFVPHTEPFLVLIDQASYKMRTYVRGKQGREYDVSFGQASGPKQVEGDNKTPVGMYFVINKHKGNFDGPYADYYGGHWIKINYPNKYDADRGRSLRIINDSQATSIANAWQTRSPTPQNTGLGGGIGFHGWIREWDNSGPRHLSWGCVVLHLNDVASFYDQISQGAMVVIF